MSKKQNIFVRSLHELKSTRCIAVTALLIAINITLDLLGLTIKLPPNLRIGFGFLCNAAIGMLFGPVVGMMAGVCTDVLGYFAGNLSMGAYFPGYTLTAVVGGLIWGLWLYPRKITVWRAIGAIPAILITLLIDPPLAIAVGIFVLILQQFDGNYLGPKILGNSVDLNPLWIILAVLIGGAFMGPVGMFVGVPVFATIKTFASEYVNRKYIEKYPTDDPLSIQTDSQEKPGKIK